MYFSSKLNKFENIKHHFFSRNNGFSKEIYRSLNCGKGSMDKKEVVSKNLQYVSEYIGVKNKNLILMNQTHSNKVAIINQNNKDDGTRNSDAIITQIKGLALGVLTADCVPILLYDKKNEIIGCVHAGWKGSISGIIMNTLNEFKNINPNNEIIACIGPCIGKSSYEVDSDFFEQFILESKKNSSFFLKKNKQKFLFNIRGYVGKKLKEGGVKVIDNIDLDTFTETNNFFSYRRSQKLREKDYGRCISTICLKT
mgnify:FL=1|jgi:YfiH family protein